MDRQHALNILASSKALRAELPPYIEQERVNV